MTCVGILQLLIVVCLLGGFLFLTFLSAFRPEKILIFQARIYHLVYKDYLHMSDQDMNKVVLDPMTKALLNVPWSQLVNKGEQHPQEFVQVLRFYRTIGRIMLAMLLIGIIGFIWTNITK